MPSLRLEGIIVERVLARLPADAAARVRARELSEIAHSVLCAPELAASELEFLESRDAEDGQSRATMDALIEARAQSALEAVWAAAARAAGVPSGAPVPRVRVERALRDGRPAGLGQLLGSIDAKSREEMLVLADSMSVNDALTAMAESSANAAPVAIEFRAGLDSERILMRPAGEARVRVVECSTTFRELEATLGRAVHTLRGTPTVRRPEVDPESRVGMLLDGKFHILSVIGRGGFGTVYEARDVRLDHRVAIKVLNADDAEELANFRDEARRLTRLNHPNIVAWKTFDEASDGTSYIVMELLEGEDLSRTIAREGKLDPRRTARLLLDVLEALRAAHGFDGGESILHLDLKPKNVLLVRDPHERGRERAKVIDFGIAQHAGCAPTEPSSVAPRLGGLIEEPDGTLRSMRGATPHGEAHDGSRAVACTPEYAAPELCAHLLPRLAAPTLDGRADLYSLGVMGFEMLVGRLPYDPPARRRDLLVMKQERDTPRLAACGLRAPRALIAFLDRCLERDPRRRFGDADEACIALRRIVRVPVGQRIGLVSAAVAVVLTVALWIAWPTAAPTPFELLASLDGVATRVSGATLHLGPARSSVEITCEGLELHSAPSAVEVCASRDEEAAALAGFTCRALENGRFMLTGDAGSARASTPAWVRLRDAAGQWRWSMPFEIVWLGQDSVRVESTEVEGLDGRNLDPRGARLLVRVAGSADDVESVVVHHGGRSFGAERFAALSGEQSSTYALDLDALAWKAGPAELVVEARDRAGRVLASDVDLDVALGDPAFLDVRLECPRVAGRYSIAPGVSPAVVARLARAADVTWSILDENGAELARDSRQAVRELRVALPDLGLLARGHSFEGRVRVVADEGRFVLHTNTSARATEDLDFVYDEELPRLGVRAGVRGARAPTDVPVGGVVYLSSPELALVLTRLDDLPVEVHVECASVGGGTAPAPVAPQRLVERSQRAFASDLDLPGPGEYELRVRAWRLRTSDAELPAEPDFEFTGRLVAAGGLGTLVIQAPAEAPVTSDVATTLTASVRRIAADDERAPVPVHASWRVERESDGAVVARGEFAEPLADVAERTFDVDAGTLADGGWRLVVAGIDAAGRSLSEVEQRFDVARSGPALELARPLEHERWNRSEKGAFELSLVAADPNGTRSVRAEILRAGAEDDVRACELSSPSGGDAATAWSGSVLLPDAWSEAEVEIRIAAEDVFGVRSTLVQRRTLARLELRFPERLAFERDGHPLASMVLIPGNPKSEYVFGGRADAEEERVLRSAGLGAYNVLGTQRSLRVPYAAGEIASYYLDEREVTVGEFLVFVRDPAGAAACWDDSARRAELERALSDLDPALPVTGVDWREADAYARWAGKRLPSWVEWEFALRGGTQYRGGHAPSPASMSRLLPGGTSDDFFSDTGIRDLCGSAAEWTSTPASFLADGAMPRNMAQHAQEHRLAFLDPSQSELASRAPRYWVVGGSGASRRHDFSVVERRPREARDAWIGFRCALSAGKLESSPSSVSITPEAPR